MRTTLSTTIKRLHNISPFSAGTPSHLPISSFNYKPYSKLADKNICQCGAILPSVERILSIYKSRELRAVTQLVNCKKLKSYDFIKRNDCELSKELDRVSALMLSSFEDVIYIDKEPFVMLESLKPIPAGDLGDLTGDHGKQVSKFLKYCLKKRLISGVGSLLDIGGQNTSTVELISQVLGKPNLPSMIIDLSSVTPALTPVRHNIKYAIGNAYLFFSSESYHKCVKDIINEEPTLFLFNNILNVLKAKDGWTTLQAAWARLRTGDYLFISGLVQEQLEKYGMKKFHEIDGIAEFHNKDGFYKSALLPNFADFVELRLDNASVLIKETFEQIIEAKQLNLIEVQGCRLLALRKS